VRPGGAVGRHPGHVLPAVGWAACVSHGAAPPSLRADRVERAESDHPVRDPGGRLRAGESRDVETPMKGTFDVTGKRITVAGAARSGLAAAELLARRGARVTLSESRAEIPDADRLTTLGVTLELGGHQRATFTDADLVVLSPGVPPEQPAV